MSLPVYPSSASAMRVRFTSGPSRLPASVTAMMSRRVTRSGRSTYNEGKKKQTRVIVSQLDTSHHRHHHCHGRYKVCDVTMMRLGRRRSTASSRSKGRFVEAMTTTRSLVVRRPSHSCISVVFTEVRVPWELSSPCSRDDNTESTSSR